MGMRRVIVPPSPGTVSAFGAVIADERVDRRATVVRRLDRPEAADIAAELERLARSVAAELIGQREDRDARMVVTTTVACRYLGQNYEQEVRTYSGHVDKSFELAIAITPDAPDFVARLAQGFHDLHRQAYGYDLVDQPIQSVYLGATAVVASAPVTVQPYPGVASGQPPHATRRVLASAGRWVDATIWERADLPAGFRVEGPAIVEEPDSTTWIPLGFTAEVHPTSCLVLSQIPEVA
jgi:N-methylhydantoinase A